MGNYGFKVSQPGFDVKTATPSQLVFSSKYQTLKVKQQGSGTITDSGGRTVTIPHNLGYVPMFLVHSQIDERWAALYGDADDYFISPFRYPAGACWVDRDVIAWADLNNLYIKVRPEFGWIMYGTELASNNYAWKWEDFGEWTGVFVMGRENNKARHGAVRFPTVNINKNETFYKVELRLWIANRDGSSAVQMKWYGIDEDDTGAFGSPFGRAQTSASWTGSFDQSAGAFFTQSAKAMVEEINSRGGWSSGNAIGFLFFDNGTADENGIDTSYIEDDSVYCSYTNLAFLKSNTLMNYKYTIYLNEVNP